MLQAAIGGLSSPGSRKTHADAVPRAVRAVWGMLLDRVSSQQLLEAELARQLPLAAAAGGSAGPILMAFNSSVHAASISRGWERPAWSGDFSTAAMAQVALFVPLPDKSSSCSKPLLPQQPQLTVAVLQPHVEGLTQVLTAAPAAFKALQELGFQPTWDEQIELPADVHLEKLVPLALWMLQSYASAVQQQQNQDWSVAPVISACSWERVLAAVAEMLPDAAGNFDRFKRPPMQAAALQLARSLLPLAPVGVQPAAGSSAWRGVVAALVWLLRRSAELSAVSAIVQKPLLVCTCNLVSDIAKAAPQLLLEVTGPAPIGNSNKNSNLIHAQQLAAALAAFVGGLTRSTLARSSSCRKELLRAAEDALAAVEQVVAGR